MNETSHSWKSLYNASGTAALIFVIYSLATMIVVFAIGGPPEGAQQGFAMLQENRLLGLLRLDVLTIFAVPLYYVIFLGLYAALEKAHRTHILLATMLAVVGVTLFLATPSVFSFLALSDKFAAATSEVQKAQFLAAGEAVLASDMWHSSGALIGGLLQQIGAVLFAVVMLRSSIFSRFTGWVGLATYGLDLAHIVIGLFFPTGGLILMMIAGPLYLVWFPLLALDFFRLARSQGDR
jgi:hypothetical protein